jgi:hypothetical protein
MRRIGLASFGEVPGSLGPPRRWIGIARVAALVTGAVTVETIVPPISDTAAGAPPWLLPSAGALLVVVGLAAARLEALSGAGRRGDTARGRLWPWALFTIGASSILALLAGPRPAWSFERFIPGPPPASAAASILAGIVVLVLAGLVLEEAMRRIEGNARFTLHATDAWRFLLLGLAAPPLLLFDVARLWIRPAALRLSGRHVAILHALPAAADEELETETGPDGPLMETTVTAHAAGGSDEDEGASPTLELRRTRLACPPLSTGDLLMVRGSRDSIRAVHHGLEGAGLLGTFFTWSHGARRLEALLAASAAGAREATTVEARTTLYEFARDLRAIVDAHALSAEDRRVLLLKREALLARLAESGPTSRTAFGMNQTIAAGPVLRGELHSFVRAGAAEAAHDIFYVPYRVRPDGTAWREAGPPDPEDGAAVAAALEKGSLTWFVPLDARLRFYEPEHHGDPKPRGAGDVLVYVPFWPHGDGAQSLLSGATVPRLDPPARRVLPTGTLLA